MLLPQFIKEVGSPQLLLQGGIKKVGEILALLGQLTGDKIHHMTALVVVDGEVFSRLGWRASVLKVYSVAK